MSNQYFRCPHCDRLIHSIEDHFENQISELLESLSDRFSIGEVFEKEKKLELLCVDTFEFFDPNEDPQYIKECIELLPYIFHDFSEHNGYLVLIFDREDIF